MAGSKLKNSRVYLIAIMLCALIEILVFGGNFNRLSIPYAIFEGIFFTCAIISTLSYAAIIYLTILKWRKNTWVALYLGLKLLLIGFLVFLTVFPVVIGIRTNN
jgi:hypothetical protein